MMASEIETITPRNTGSRIGGSGVARATRAIAKFARRKPLGFIGAVLVVLFLAMALFAPLIAPYAPNRIDLRNALHGPSSQYLLGTDNVGHDILSRLIWGARVSMTVGFGAVVFSGICATTLALLSAYTGGWVDMVISRLVDAMIAMPGLVVLITILGIVRRTDTNMVVAMLVALGLLRIAPVTRIYRSSVIELRNRPFVESAEAAGAGPLRVMWRHVFPNIVPLIVVTSTIALPATILAEASLSFLGLGPAGQPSWGQMLSVDGRDYFRKQPGLAIYPGLAIFFAVFGFNMFGDALRDVLDPRLRGSGRH
jgi:peptide/nickel transport system permease protein